MVWQDRMNNFSNPALEVLCTLFYYGKNGLASLFPKSSKAQSLKKPLHWWLQWYVTVLLLNCENSPLLCSLSIAFMSGRMATWKDDPSLPLSTVKLTRPWTTLLHRSKLTSIMQPSCKHVVRDGHREAGMYSSPSFISFANWSSYNQTAFSRDQRMMTSMIMLGTKWGWIDVAEND